MFVGKRKVQMQQASYFLGGLTAVPLIASNCT
jgi:hypothetical protein